MRSREVLGADDIARSLIRIASEIIECDDDTKKFTIAGIPTCGAFLARRLVERISEVGGPTAEYAIIDPTMFRDGLADKPPRTPKPTLIPLAGIDGRTMILVDDVFYTGRTIKATLDALSGIGRPSRVQLAVLVDHGYRELLIRPGHISENPPTSRQETTTVLLKKSNRRDGVLLGKEN